MPNQYKYIFFIQLEICGRFDFHFEAVLTWDRFDWGRLRTIWPGVDLTGNRKKSLCVKSYLLTIVQLKQLIRWLVLNPSFPFKSVLSLHCLYSLFFSLTILFLFRISVVWYVYLFSYRMWISLMFILKKIEIAILLFKNRFTIYDLRVPSTTLNFAITFYRKS